MKYTPTTDKFHDTIHLVDQTTPVQGGTPVFDAQGNPIKGASNASRVQLADNIAYLKKGLETATTDVDALESRASELEKNTVRRKNHAELRAYSGPATIVDLSDDGIFGRFHVASSGSENGGTLIVGSDGRRWKRPSAEAVSPLWFGAVGDGLQDDTVGIQKAINAHRHVDMSGKTWKVSGKITVPSYRFIDLRGSDINADNGTDPIFEFETAGDGLSILHGAGVITGTASAFLKCSGTTNAPTAVNQYARQIRLEGLHISSGTIENFLDFQGAVRQVFMHKVQAYTKNGINANGKCVEVKGHACVIYGSTNSLTTYGIKLRGPGGGSAYPEGFHFTDSIIDAFGTTWDVTDIYVMSVTGGHTGCTAGGKVATFGQPTSSACRDIKFTGVNISGPIEFAPTGGLAYHAQFTGCASENCTGTNISIKNNAASIDISDHKFHTSINGVPVACDDNNANINIRGISCDASFVSGVQIKGSAGANCSVRDISYAGTGDSVYLERPVLLSGIPVTSATVLSYLQTFNPNGIQGAYAVSSNIASVTSWFAKGETGEIICEISFNGANASTQRFAVVVPSGMEIPGGSGWGAGFIQPNTIGGRISVRIPYRVTADMTGRSVVLKNAAGNSINIDYHSSFGFRRDW